MSLFNSFVHSLQLSVSLYYYQLPPQLLKFTLSKSTMSPSWCISSTKHPSPLFNRISTDQMNKKPSDVVTCTWYNRLYREHPSKLTPLNSFSHILTLPIPKPTNQNFSSSKFIRCLNENQDYEPTLVNFAEKPTPKWQNMLSTAASLYPVYVTVGGVVACFSPSTFLWFVNRGPFSYSLSLGLIMFAMGLTLEFKDLINLFKQRPFSILAGCVAQYAIMPSLGWLISKFLALPPAVSVGLILLSCCPGGTASNVVTLIARGDVPLSIVMTSCTTVAAVLLTPLLTKCLAGTYVPVDAIKLSVSTLQVVVAPVFLGLLFQSTVPGAVQVVTPYSPLFAVLTSSLLACSVFSENVIRLKSMMANTTLTSNLDPYHQIQAILSKELGITILSVLLLHSAGFFLGYVYSAICGFRETQRRAISIEVGMQNSSLGVVLATSHFTSPMVALPAAISAVIMNIMGSSLGFIWRYIDPVDDQKAYLSK